jgi:hypothetical protein
MLTPVKFNEHKNEKDENGQFTERAQKIREALARGRSKLNQVVRRTMVSGVG